MRMFEIVREEVPTGEDSCVPGLDHLLRERQVSADEEIAVRGLIYLV